MNNGFWCGVCALVLSGCAGGGGSSGPGELLFSGTDLAGWKSSGSAVWRASEGVLTGGQDGDPRRSGVLFTEKTFVDFDLSLEFLIDEHGKYNSGVYLRYRPELPLRDTLQVNIGRGAAGEPVGLYRRDWLHRGDDRDEVRLPFAWNQLRIRAIGNRVHVWLNGRLIVEHDDSRPDQPLVVPGAIALQTYGAEGHAGWVKFRNIRVTELK